MKTSIPCTICGTCDFKGLLCNKHLTLSSHLLQHDNVNWATQSSWFVELSLCSYKNFQPCLTTLSSSHHPDLTCLLDLCNQRGIKEVFSGRAERFFQAYHGSGRPRTSLDLNFKLVRFQPSEWCKLNLANYRRPKELRLLHCWDVHPSIQKTSSRTHGELWPATMQPSQYVKSSKKV